jgi:hypothetical protein
VLEAWCEVRTGRTTGPSDVAEERRRPCRDRWGHDLFHQSACKGDSTKFAFTEFSEVRDARRPFSSAPRPLDNEGGRGSGGCGRTVSMRPGERTSAGSSLVVGADREDREGPTPHRRSSPPRRPLAGTWRRSSPPSVPPERPRRRCRPSPSRGRSSRRAPPSWRSTGTLA